MTQTCCPARSRRAPGTRPSTSCYNPRTVPRSFVPSCKKSTPKRTWTLCYAWNGTGNRCRKSGNARRGRSTGRILPSGRRTSWILTFCLERWGVRVTSDFSYEVTITWVGTFVNLKIIRMGVILFCTTFCMSGPWMPPLNFSQVELVRKRLKDTSSSLARPPLHHFYGFLKRVIRTPPLPYLKRHMGDTILGLLNNIPDVDMYLWVGRCVCACFPINQISLGQG